MLVFLKENIGFLKAGELPGGPEGRAGRRLERSLGRPGGRQARLGGFWDLVGASEGLRKRFLDVWEAHLEALGTTLGDLGVDFFTFLKNSLPTSAELMRIAMTVSGRTWRTPVE